MIIHNRRCGLNGSSKHQCGVTAGEKLVIFPWAGILWTRAIYWHKHSDCRRQLFSQIAASRAILVSQEERGYSSLLFFFSLSLRTICLCWKAERANYSGGHNVLMLLWAGRQLQVTLIDDAGVRPIRGLIRLGGWLSIWGKVRIVFMILSGLEGRNWHRLSISPWSSCYHYLWTPPTIYLIAVRLSQIHPNAFIFACFVRCHKMAPKVWLMGKNVIDDGGMLKWQYQCI